LLEAVWLIIIFLMDQNSFDLDRFLQNHKLTIILALFGLILLGTGFLIFQKMFSEEPKMEFIRSADVRQGEEEIILADIAGAVLKPGVYELKFGSRVNDLLVLAGGLSLDADRDWVAKNLNLAQKVIDGAKIYIPKTGETNPSNFSNPSFSSNSSDILSKININTATIPELDTLWGIGEATARKIVAGRPYQKIEDLVNKSVITTSVFERIKDRITVF